MSNNICPACKGKRWKTIIKDQQWECRTCGYVKGGIRSSEVKCKECEFPYGKDEREFYTNLDGSVLCEKCFSKYARSFKPTRWQRIIIWMKKVFTK